MRTAIIMLTLLVVLAVIMFIPVRVKFYLMYENSEFWRGYQIKYGFFTLKKSNGLKSKKTDKKQDKTDKEKKQKLGTMNIIRFFIRNKADVKNLITSVFVYLTKHAVKIDNFSLDAKIGTDDAMQTALLYGGFSAFIYNALAGIERLIKTKGIRIDSRPDFNGPQIFIKFESIIRTTIYNIVAIAVIALFKAIPLWKKRGELKNGKSD